MLIGGDSPLRNLPQALAERQVLFIDGIRYSIEMTEIAFMRLRETLLNLSIQEEPPALLYPLAFLDAWSLVDSLNRLRILVTHMPSLKRSAWVKALLRKVAPVEDLRNPVQHLNHEIANLAKAKEPVWGWLTWVGVLPEQTGGDFSFFWLLPGSLKVGEWASPSMFAGGEVAAPIDRIDLAAYSHRVSLSDMFQAVSDFTPRLEASVQDAMSSQLPDAPKRGSDAVMRMDARRGLGDDKE